MSDISGKTVYMVSTGEYSSFSYVAAFSRRIAAEAYAASFPRYEMAEVHEWVVDDELSSDTHGLFPYYVEISASGDVSTCRRLSKGTVVRWSIRNDANTYFVRCMAKNRLHAAKVAMEQVMQHQAARSS